MSDTECIAFTGGGTGGHIYPGLAVIEALKVSYKGRIVWIGSGLESERSAVQNAGIEFFSVPSGKLRRSMSIRNVPDAFKVLLGYFASLRILKRLQPALLFSKGGYVSVPPCRAAASLGIPVFTHESDLSPGLATRLNAGVAEKVLLGWEATLAALSPNVQAKAVVCGNPVRMAFSIAQAERGRKFLGFADDLPVIMVLGGSQGAVQVNELVQAILPSLAGRARVVHQTGPGNGACSLDSSYYRAFPYLRDELPDVLAAADIVIGRAGAGTIGESIASAKPMILIPLSGASTRGDQVENARMLESHGAAICLSGSDANPSRLLAALETLLSSPAARVEMAQNAARIAPVHAAQNIAQLILDRVNKKGNRP
ncbi:MAG TPA: undecaprenyldiphospho-muramoylpentapeptide beta-N-acetylglucosaminyltransferase [Spirochaetales bacterium]|nr:undecaprenyldiphospho-muramoylpentapeptide beta-N-acetylglucosaminyltransferase [Spirochaetales bacterium]